jgi:hypothetical protein
MIERVIDQIASSHRPSTGDDLSGFVHDLDWALEDGEEFESFEVHETSDPRELIRVQAVFKPGAVNIQALGQALDRVWSSVGYQFFRASSLTRYRDATVLRFVTVIGAESFFVAGSLRVTASDYATLVSQFEKDFESLGALISTEPSPNG